MLRELGRSGIKIHPLGMGCWSYGGGSYWGEQSQTDVNNVVSAALSASVNFFDTAEAYNGGASEVALGVALAGKRDKAIVATKISPGNCGETNLEAHLDASLKRLNMDYVDVYMLHWPINQKAVEHFVAGGGAYEIPTVEKTFELLKKMKEKGKIRSIGVSNFGATQLAEALATGVQIDINEITYNIVSRAIERDIVPICEKNNVSIVGSMALMQGLLAGIYKSVDDIPAAQAHSRHFKQSRGGAQSRHFEDGAEDEIFELLPKLKEIAADSHISLAQLSIAWVLNKPFMTSTLVGSRNTTELYANIDTARIKLSSETMGLIDKLSEPVLLKLGYNADYYENTKDSRIY